MTDVAAQDLQGLLDHHAIVATAIRYTWALDMREWDQLDDVFLPDATACFMGGDPHPDRNSIKARISSALGRMDHSQHIVSNHQVTIDGDHAIHRCYMQAQHVRKDVDGGSNYIIAGRYEDTMVRVAAGWRISHRDLIMMWGDGNPEVIRR